MITPCFRCRAGQRGVGVGAQENCAFGLALVPVENVSVVICGHPRASWGWYVVLCLLLPMMGSQQHPLEGWHIECMRYSDGGLVLILAGSVCFIWSFFLIQTYAA